MAMPGNGGRDGVKDGTYPGDVKRRGFLIPCRRRWNGGAAERRELRETIDV